MFGTRSFSRPTITLEGENNMPDILHKVGIKSSSLNDVYTALTTLEGLSAWWTTTTQGESKAGGAIQFRFGGDRGFDMKVLELHPARRVLWQVAEGPEEWIGTKVSFDLRQEGDWTILFFKHEGWKEPVEFMHHCSTKWAVFLLSLKSYLETGKGAPWPNEIKLDSWE
jgi:uncharacterized protein YndB with AHSA1/START domain